MRCYCKILRISYKDRVANEEDHAKIQQTIEPHEDLLTIEKRRKVEWYGHVSRSSGVAKTILQGTVKGGRRQGRHEEVGKTTPGNGQVWSFSKSQKGVDNRKKWKKLVVKSSVVSQRPSRLRDR